MTEIGYITLALNGRPYAELAHNLAGSIRASHWEAKIAVVTNMGEAFGQYAQAFDEVIHVTGTNANILKTEIYGLTPWKNTVFVDADSLFLFTHHNLKDFEANLEDKDLAFPVLGRFRKSQARGAPLSWVKLDELWGHYGITESGMYPALDSSLFYFRKSKVAGSFFRKAAKLYGDFPGIGKGHPVPNYPDEVAFSTAAALQGLDFGSLDGLTYRALSAFCNRTQALAHPWYSMPGNPAKDHQKFYNAVVQNCGHYVGRAYHFRK